MIPPNQNPRLDQAYIHKEIYCCFKACCIATKNTFGRVEYSFTISGLWIDALFLDGGVYFLLSESWTNKELPSLCGILTRIAHPEKLKQTNTRLQE